MLIKRLIDLISFLYFRYNAIIRPLRPRMGRPMTILMAILIWVVGMIIAIPQLLYFTTQYFPDSGTIMCITHWPDYEMLQEGLKEGHLGFEFM